MEKAKSQNFCSLLEHQLSVFMFMIGAMSVSKVYIGNLAEDARYCCQNNSLIATPI